MLERKPAVVFSVPRGTSASRAGTPNDDKDEDRLRARQRTTLDRWRSHADRVGVPLSRLIRAQMNALVTPLPDDVMSAP